MILVFSCSPITINAANLEKTSQTETSIIREISADIGEGLISGWEFVKNLFSKDNKEIPVVVEKKINTVTPVSNIKKIQEPVITENKIVDNNLVENKKADIPPSLTTVQNINNYPQTTVINKYYPTTDSSSSVNSNLVERVQGVELAILNNIDFNSKQTDHIYESVNRSIQAVSDTLTKSIQATSDFITSTTINGHPLTSDVIVTASDVGLGNVTNESKATMFTNPTFTGLVAGFGTSGNIDLGANTLTTTNSTVATNLNADLLDGQHGSYYATASGYIPYTGGTTDVNLGLHNLTVDTNTLFVDSINHKVGIGTITPDNSAILDLSSTTKGFLPPRLTSIQKNAISTPASGLMIFDTTLSKLNVWNGSAWKNVGNPEIGGDVSGSTAGSILFINSSGLLSQDNSNLFYDGTLHRLGVGVATPNNLIQVANLINFNDTDFNTSIGKNAGLNIVSGATQNTFLGYEAGSGGVSGTNLADYNTGVGYRALFSNTTGNNNTANGMSSLQNNTTGSGNTANGDQSLIFNTTGNNNTANGAYSLAFNTTGYNNTANGVQSLYSNKANRRSTAIGYNSMYYADDRTVGQDTFNTAVGYEALKGSTTASANTGQYNTAVGDSALWSITSGNYNTAIGNYSLYLNTTGSYNTASGFQTLNSNTTGNSNTANGYYSLYSNSTGAQNTSSGYYSLNANTTGMNNTASGTWSLNANLTGNENTAIGVNSLRSNKGNNRSTSLGFQSMMYADDRITGQSTFNTAVGYEALRGSTTASANIGQYNTAIGDSVLWSNTSGIFNTGLGYQALYSNTTGTRNFASGYGALGNNTTGSYNTASGMSSLFYNKANNRSTAIGFNAMFNADDRTVGQDTFNTAVGYEALKGSGTPGNNTGQYNTAIGDSALFSNTSGIKNTSNGYQSLYSNTTGFVNVANGYQSLYSNTTGTYNTANGASSLYLNTTGSNNTANGYSSLSANITGSSNTANGMYSLYFNTTGSSNTANGVSSLYFNNTGLNNTANGVSSLSGSGSTRTAGSFIVGVSYTIQATGSTDFTLIGAANSTPGTSFTATGVGTGNGTASSNSNNNIGIGYQAGRYISGGATGLYAPSDSIFIGTNTKALADGGTNEIVIGQNVTGNGSNTTTIGTGNVLYVGGTSIAANGLVARFTNNSGTCDINPVVGGIACSSDINLKKNITTLQGVSYDLKSREVALESIPDLLQKTTLEKIMEITPVNYNWNTENDTDSKHIGFIAQEMEYIFPNIVSTDTRGTVDPITGKIIYLKSISYASITPYLVKGIQEMNLQIKDLQSLDTTKATSLGSLIKNLLADIGNNITDLYASVIHSEKVNTKELCVGNTCVTEQEFLEIVNKNVTAPMAPSTSVVSTPLPASVTLTPDSNLAPDTSVPPTSGESTPPADSSSTDSGSPISSPTM